MMTLWQSMTRNWGRRTPNKGMGFFRQCYLVLELVLPQFKSCENKVCEETSSHLFFPGIGKCNPHGNLLWKKVMMTFFLFTIGNDMFFGYYNVITL